MDHLSQLPVECLQHIITIFSRKHDTHTLSTLLRLNKTIAFVTIPYLYTDPFQEPFHYKETRRYDPISSSHRLVRALFCRTPFNYLSDLLCLTYQLDPPKDTSTTIDAATALTATTTIPTSPLDYFAHIRHMNLEPSAVDVKCFWPRKGIPFGVSRYLESETFKTLYEANRLDVSASLALFRSETTYIRHFHEVIAYRHAVRALSMSILEQLQSLSIPVSDIENYLEAVGRMQSLERVRFVMDELYEHNDTPVSEAAGSRKEEVLRMMVQFVSEHAELHKEKLKSVATVDSGLWSRAVQSCPGDVQLELSRVLPRLRRPRVLDDDNWLQFVAHLRETDLGHVQEITFPTSGQDVWYETLCNNREFLQRCRSLKRLDVLTHGKGSFKWAVQEKQELDCVGQCRPGYVEYGLVPIEVLSIREYKTPLTDEVDDIVHAFSQTLTQLTVIATLFGSWESFRILYIGQGWVDLPRLTLLFLRADCYRLIIDPQLLQQCPNLQIIELFDKTLEYRCQDIVPCHPARLSSLKTLTLCGWSALTFHPATLESCKNLGFLKIIPSHSNSRHCFVPPVQELDRSYGLSQDTDSNNYGEAGGVEMLAVIIRPQWTWDWDLPQLKTLVLNGEVAYRFEFRMLVGCPCLETLSLNMSTGRDEHTRTISNADLFLPASNDNDDDDNDSVGPPLTRTATPTRIVAPALQTLSMHGRWIFDGTSVLLSSFLSGMFPNLVELNEKDWSGVKAKHFVETVTTAAANNNNKLREVYLNLDEPSKREIEMYRILPENEVEQGQAFLGVRFWYIGNRGTISGPYVVLRPEEEDAAVKQ